MRWSTLALATALAAALAAGCKDSSGGRPAPLVVESSAKPGPCAAGGGHVTDERSAAVFPQRIMGYCVDPNGETRVFGEGQKLPMDAICTEAFDGECEVYKSFGLRRVVGLRYIDGAGSPGTVEIYQTQFATADGAYAMFTKRVVGDSDPREGAPRVLDAGAAAALGIGRAYVYRGFYLVEIQYGNEQETPEQTMESADRVLVPLAKEIGAKLPGPPVLPPAAAQLPKDKLVPLGISHSLKDALGVEGAGPGAVGLYADGKRRYRIASTVRGDEDEAKDLLQLFARRRSATEEKYIGDSAYRYTVPDPDGAKLEYTIARSGRVVLAIGDEPFAVQPGMSAAEREKVCLSQSDKVARLRAALAAAGK
jgi:hypothetical protein